MTCGCRLSSTLLLLGLALKKSIGLYIYPHMALSLLVHLIKEARLVAALDRSISNGFLEISRLLLEAGANVNITENNGTTSLVEARFGTAEIVRLLIENGADVDLAHRHFNETPLLCALYMNHIEVVRMLLAAGANSTAQTLGGHTSLHCALNNKNEDIATLILEHDPDADASSQLGLRPLHLAAEAGFTDICARLLNLGASVNAMDDGGLAALRVAVQGGHLETIKLLVERVRKSTICHQGMDAL